MVDFYQILQKEYICYSIRSMIYPEEYAIKYRNYCTGKREKIEKIAIRNCSMSIFKSEEYRKKYFSQVINQFGLPNFEYRDEKSKSIMGFWDRVYWFQVGVKVEDNKGSKYEIVRNLPIECKVVVKQEGKRGTTTFSYSDVSRCSTEEFLKIN